jgi:hypothetical protein
MLDLTPVRYSGDMHQQTPEEAVARKARGGDGEV